MRRRGRLAGRAQRTLLRLAGRARRTLLRLAWLLPVLVCASGAASRADEAGAPRAPAPTGKPGELLDCSVEYAALPDPESYVFAINDVAGSYLAAKRQHETLRKDLHARSDDVEEAWRTRIGAAQTLLRACHCWDQLDRLAYTGGVLATRNMSAKKLKEEIGEKVAGPCQKVFQAEAAGR